MPGDGKICAMLNMFMHENASISLPMTRCSKSLQLDSDSRLTHLNRET